MSKIAITHNGLHVEYEGEDNFIKDNLIDLVSDVLGLLLQSSTVIQGAPNPSAGNSVSVPNYSVKTISSKLGNDKGSDLARAAAVFLSLVQKQETFTQPELLKAMKSATGVYKQTTHGKKMGDIVSGLMSSGFLFQTATGAYCVSQAELDGLASILAQ